MSSTEPDWRSSSDGQPLRLRERASYVAQGVIRRWTFIAIITLATVAVLFFIPSQRTNWNYAASYLALLIESIVGIGLFQQTKKDAVYLRHIYALERKIEDLEQAAIRQGEHIIYDLERSIPRNEAHGT